MAITYKVAKLLSVCYWIVQYSPTPVNHLGVSDVIQVPNQYLILIYSVTAQLSDIVLLH